MTVAFDEKVPSGPEFEPRRPEFELREALAGDWCCGDPFRTAYFNAMSMLFPLGEKFFIDSVRYFNDKINDPNLKKQVVAFQGQEAVHRLNHQRYNELLCEARGYDLEQFESIVRDRIAWVHKNFSPLRQLAGTVANEHLTAIMADDLLRHPETVAEADPRVMELWRWHAIEETEHKAVAFDVYATVGGSLGRRRHALFMATFFFLKDTFRNARIMLRHDGQLWRWKTWTSAMSFLFLRPGVLRRVVPAWFRFLRRGFHPWNYDNRALIVQWESQSASIRDPD